MRCESKPSDSSPGWVIASGGRDDTVGAVCWQERELHVAFGAGRARYRYRAHAGQCPALQWLEGDSAAFADDQCADNQCTDEPCTDEQRTDDQCPDDQWLCALLAFEAVFNRQPGARHIEVALPDALARLLLRRGVAIAEGGRLRVCAELFWQQPALWLRGEPCRYPLQPIVENGRRHPRRPPKPEGELYARRIPWLGQTLSFHALELERDLETVHRWLNDPHVAFFWQEEGDLERHREYLGAQLNDAHTLPVIGCFDGRPFGYFELYWAKEDRIAPFYDADDFDRGWHVLVGEADYRGRPWFSAWFPSLMHYLFLDDCRTRRIVAEPRVDNRRLLRSSARSGFSQIKEFDFPHKRAMLLQLLRERFFGEGLLFPGADD